MLSSISRSSDRRRAPRSRFLPGPRPRRIAHRGLALDGAENTLRAFEDALREGTAGAQQDLPVRTLSGDFDEWARGVAVIAIQEFAGAAP